MNYVQGIEIGLNHLLIHRVVKYKQNNIFRLPDSIVKRLSSNFTNFRQ